MEYILGIIVSLLVVYLKKKYKTEEYKTLAVLLGLSLGVSGAYVFLRDYTEFLPTIIQILETAGVFYAFVILRFKD